MATNKRLDEQGEAAKKLYSTITQSSKHYNERRRAQTEELRSVLEPVWQALAEGKTVNGCADKLSWSKWANPESKHPERWFYSVMRDKAGLKSVQRMKTKAVVIREGMIFSAQGLHSNLVQREYEVLNVRKHGVNLIPVDEKQGVWLLSFRVRPVVAKGESVELRLKPKAKAAAAAAA